MALNPTSTTTGSTSHQAFWLTVFELTRPSRREPPVDVQLRELGVEAHVRGPGRHRLALVDQKPDHGVVAPGLHHLVPARVADPGDAHGDPGGGEPDELRPDTDFRPGARRRPDAGIVGGPDRQAGEARDAV